MELDMESNLMESERGVLDTSIPAACSFNGIGGEEDEAEAIGRAREAAVSGILRCPNGGGLLGGGGGREQEVSVEIGETYLCQRADKTWRECRRNVSAPLQKALVAFCF